MTTSEQNDKLVIVIDTLQSKFDNLDNRYFKLIIETIILPSDFVDNSGFSLFEVCEMEFYFQKTYNYKQMLEINSSFPLEKHKLNPAFLNFLSRFIRTPNKEVSFYNLLQNLDKICISSNNENFKYHGESKHTNKNECCIVSNYIVKFPFMINVDYIEMCPITFLHGIRDNTTDNIIKGRITLKLINTPEKTAKELERLHNNNDEFYLPKDLVNIMKEYIIKK
jgi:hypothetical protein